VETVRSLESTPRSVIDATIHLNYLDRLLGYLDSEGGGVAPWFSSVLW